MSKWTGVSISPTTVRILVATGAADEAPLPLLREEQAVRVPSTAARGGEEAVTTVVSAVWRFQRTARRYGAELDRLVGSATLRRNPLLPLLSARLQQTVGMPLDVLGADEEAAAVHRAVAATYARPERVLGTLDIGPTHTDLTSTGGLEPGPAAAAQVPSGGRLLIGRFGLHLAAPDATWQAVRADLAWTVAPPAAELRPRPTQAVLLGAGGAALAQMRLQTLALRRARTSQVEGTTLPVAWLESTADHLRTLDAAARTSVPGVPLERADLLCGEAAILLAVLAAWQLPEATVTERNLLDGLVP